MISENLELSELKKRAKSEGYSKIRRQSEGASAVPLDGWNGVTSEVAPFTYTLVTYELSGNTVVVRKSGKEDIQYILS